MNKLACSFPLLLFVLLFSFFSCPELSIAGNADNFIFTGSATSSYSIEVPPGRKGVAPQLTLSYNSMGKNGRLGIGWDLSMGYIVRNTKYGIPSYNDSTDQFALNLKGASYEIIPIGGNEYRLKIESEFLKIVHESDNSWTVKDKTGTTYRFGSTGASQITNSKGTFQWNLERVEDLDGNYMTVTYQADQGQLYLYQIQYTGNSNTGDLPLNTVTFYLENRSDILRAHNSGALITTAKRLAYVVTQANGNYVLKYTFGYFESPASMRSRLETVQKYGWSGSWVQFPSETVFTCATDSVSTSSSTAMTGDPTISLSLIDMNRDGLADAVEFASGYLKYYYPNQGNGSFGSRVTITNPPPASGESFTLFDVDNDGFPDVVTGSYQQPWYYFKNNGDGSFGNQTQLNVPGGMYNIDVYNTVDINGDGLRDLLYTSYAEWHYHPNLGNASFGAAINIPHPPWSGGNPLSLWQMASYTWRFADINGDGLLDFVRLSGMATVGTDKLLYWPNTGGDFESGYDGGIPGYNAAIAINVPAGSPNLPYGERMELVDMNGDGLADAVQGKAGDYKYWPNLGDDTFGNPVTLSGPNENYNSSTAVVSFQDVDGDGLTDVLYGAANNYQYWKLQTSNNTFPNLLIHVDNGTGGTTDIAYKSSTSYDNTGSDAIPDCGIPLQFVDSITNHDGMGNSYTVTYNYEGAVYDAANREYLGVRKVTTTRADGSYTVTLFRQDGLVGTDYMYKGKPESVQSYDAAGNLLSESSTTWDFVQIDHPNGKSSFFPRPRQTIARLYDGQGDYTETTTTNEYDNNTADPANIFGNITQVEVIAADGLTRYTKTQYITDTTNWVFVPEVTYVTAGDPATDTNYLRRQQFFYNEDAWPTRYHLNRTASLKEASPAAYVYSYMDYDAYGNVTRSENHDRHGTTTTYDSTYHQFPERVDNDLGHFVTSTYDYGFGSVLTSTDAAGATTKTDYDEFGRPTASYIPDFNGNPTILAKEIQYTNYADSANPNRLYTRTYVGNGTVLEEYAYSDGMGRTWETKSTGKVGELIGQRTEYDSMGRAWRSSNPYTTTAAYQVDTTGITDWTTNHYDAWDRIDQVTSPDGSIATTAFDIIGSQMHATRMDPNYNAAEPWRGKKVTVSDGFDQTVRVEEYNVDTLYATTTYQYALTGELEQVTDNAGNITKMTYNRLGWKLSMDDPDKGHVDYQYDNVGNLRYQTDNKSQQIEFQYDALNRMKKKITPEGITDYYYDEPASGYFQTGRLTRVAALGIATKFYYDSRGQSVKTDKIVDGITYVVESGYDNLGRKTTLTYPDGEVVQQTYDGSYLKTIAGESTYISAMTYNINGQVTNKTYSNGVQTTYSYYSRNFRLERILTQSGATTLQNLYFEHDKVGNTKSIFDYAPNHANDQGYTYDHLYRLVQYDLNGQTGTRTYQYDTLGNMTSNSVLGTYTYGQNGAGPHAVTTAGSLTYTYDGNGNMETGDGRTLSYDSEDRLTQAVKNGNVVNFAYDQNGDRIRKSTKTTIPNLTSAITLNIETIYLGNLYEIEKINGYVSKTTKHYYLGIDKIASREIVNGVTKSLYFYHGDQIGSSNIITDASGNEIQHIEYYPFGEIRTNENKNNSTIDVPYKFTGKELDTETDLYYYGVRYYDAKLCRFITADDIVQAPFSPQTLNRYSYCGNNPVILIDPSGHGWFKKLFKPIKKLVKGVAKAVKKVAKTVVNTVKNPKALAAIAAGFLAAPFFLAVVPEGSFFWGSVAVGAGGGAIAGGTYAAETGQNIGRGMLSGAKYGGMMGAGTALMRTGWEYAKKVIDKSSLEQWEGITEDMNQRLDKGLGTPRTNSFGEVMTAGVRQGTSKSLLKFLAMSEEGARKTRFFFHGYDPNGPFGHFLNVVSKPHDYLNHWVYEAGKYNSYGMVLDTTFDLFSFAGMPFATAYTIPAYYGPGVLTIATPVTAVDTMKNN